MITADQSPTDVLRHARILVVDDEEHIREIVCFDLEEFGAQTFQAGSGNQALKVLAKQPIDLVISDVSMPDGTGIDLLGAIHELSPIGISFLFMTGYADITADEALHLGAEEFLNKPLGLRHIASIVANALVPLEKRWRNPTARPSAWRYNEPDKAPLAVGRGGCYLGLAKDFPGCQELIALDLLPGANGSPALRGVGRVRWVRSAPSANMPPGIGIEYVHLEDTSRTELLSYLKRARPRAFLPMR